MLPKRNRLPYKDTFKLRQTGQRLKTDTFELIFKKNYFLNQSRILVQVPKRVISQAVDRNRHKRTTSEALVSLPAFKTPIDLIIKIRAPFTDYKMPQVKELLRSTFEKAGLL